MSLAPAPPPLHLRCQHPAIRIPLWRTSRCSWGCGSSSRSVSILPSSPSSQASISAELPSASQPSFQHHCVIRASYQAVTSQADSPCRIPPSSHFSLASVCQLGSWSSTVPLEDDSVDEDRRDGPGGAPGETEDSHPKHR
ncbi:uncharacterized protein V6R79_013354 [Siganus canaliculatus]